jgi:hypothetical protein
MLYYAINSYNITFVGRILNLYWSSSLREISTDVSVTIWINSIVQHMLRTRDDHDWRHNRWNTRVHSQTVFNEVYVAQSFSVQCFVDLCLFCGLSFENVNITLVGRILNLYWSSSLREISTDVSVTIWINSIVQHSSVLWAFVCFVVFRLTIAMFVHLR